MKYFATADFWQCYYNLPIHIQKLADNNYQILKDNPRHPSLHLKRIHHYWSVRVGLHYRALGIVHEGDVIWFWIGHHADYDKLVKSANN